MWSKDANPGVATKTWQNALDYVNTINVSGYMGYGDWRLPNRNELDSLLTPLANYPLISYGHPFTNVQSNYYWSSTSNLSTAYTINTVTGMNLSRTKTNGAYVWLVRGGSWSSSFQYYTIPKTGQNTCFDQSGATVTCTFTGQDGELQKGFNLPFPRFTNNGDGTATDNLTNLKWAIDANTSGPSICINAVAKTWQEALDFIKCLNNEGYLGYSDWRLPNRTELPSLADRSQNGSIFANDHPFLNINFANRYWTSSTAGTNPTYAFAAYMTDAGISATVKTTPGNVWSVRGGESITAVSLSVSKNGTSTGTITSSPAGISCGTTCTASFASATSVTLTAVPDSSTVFAGWTGCDSTNGNECTVTMSTSKSVAATFNQDLYTLVVSKVGSGTGVVAANAGTIIWNGNSGTANYSDNTSITLTATPVADSTYANWDGCDSTNGNECTVFISSSKYVTVEFTLASTIWSLPQTGQTKCYNSNGDLLPSCVGTGQDGELRIGAAWPSIRFTDNNNGTITDNLTGLIWLKDANCFGNQVWSNALSLARGLATGTCGLTDGSNLGQWRLPSIIELESIVSQEQANPYLWLNMQGFINFQGAKYLSSSTDLGYTSDARSVDMRDGNTTSNSKTVGPVYMLPVRNGYSGVVSLPKTGQTTCYDDSGATLASCAGTGQDGELQPGKVWPVPRFSNNDDQTITDNLTKLVWSKDANPATGLIPWQEALDFIKLKNSQLYLGYGDWRLPNSKELMSLTNWGSSSNSSWLSDQGFVNVQMMYPYWSSSSYSLNAIYAKILYTYGSGGLDYGMKVGGSGLYVWPVRGGQIAPTTDGVCGSSNGATLTAAPVSNLCLSDTLPTVLGSGPWYWSCPGTNGGSTSSCTAFIHGTFSYQPQRTGTNKCYDVNGGEITCSGTGQDAEYQRGAVWPDPRFTDNGSGSVIDNLTGLIWTKDANVMKSRDPEFDTDYFDWQYYSPNDGYVNWQHGLDYVDKLNTEQYLGFSDWRLPNIIELESLVDWQNSNPPLPTGHPFVNVLAFYGSSTTSADILDNLWVFFENGGINGGGAMGKSMSYSGVWPVRSGGNGVIQLPKTGQIKCYSANGTVIDCTTAGQTQDGAMQKGVDLPNPRFSLFNNGDTAVDNLTGLVWLTNGNVIPQLDSSFDSDGQISWQKTVEFIAKLNSEKYLGYNDWRIPNINELLTLVSHGETAGFGWLDTSGFSSISDYNRYWTSTRSMPLATSSLSILQDRVWALGSENYLLPVRGGQTATNGICGSSNGSVIVEAPSTNLCMIGTASSVSGVGPWNWICNGLYGGVSPNCSAVLGYNLSVSVWLETGSGGTVTSSSNTAAGMPADIICTSGTCNAVYPSGSEVSVVATPNSISQLSGMYNLTTPISSPYNFTMNGLAGPFNISFSKASFAKNATTGISYSTLTQAIVAALANAEILLLDTQHDGEVTLDKNLKLVGGWNTTYSVKSGMHSVLKGNVTVTGGNSTAETLLVLGTLIIQGGSLIANDMMIQSQ